MDFEGALKKFLSITPTAANDGGMELSKLDLASYPSRWAEIIDRLADLRGGLRPLENALSRIGDLIVPSVQSKLSEVKGEKAVSLLRILGGILQEKGRDIYADYSKRTGVVRDTALRLLAQYFPSEANDLVLKASTTQVSEDLFAALLLLGTKTGFLKAQAAAEKNRLGESVADIVPAAQFGKVIDFALEQLGSEPLGGWPFERILVTADVCKRLPAKADTYLIALLKYQKDWVQRDAAIELAKRHNPEGLETLKNKPLKDRFRAKAAVEVCLGLGAASFFDWFSEQLTTPPRPEQLSPDEAYGYVLAKLATVISEDPRWNPWLKEYQGTEYRYLDPLRQNINPPESLLLEKGPESLKALERLAENKSPLVVEWIAKRLDSDATLLREEYFSILESLRLLGDSSNEKFLTALVNRFKPTGFAKEFAEQVMRDLKGH